MKKRIFSGYLKEMFMTPGLYFWILTVAALTLLAVTIDPRGPFLNMTISFVVADSFTKNVCCILAALPVISTFCDDCKYQYQRSIVVRSGVKKYTRAKFTASMLSAFLVVALGIIIAFSIMSIYQPICDDPNNGPYGYFGDLDFGVFETMGLPALTFITRSCIFGAYAAMYALVGLAVSAFIPNKFLTLAVPFASSFLFQEISFHLFWLPNYLNIAYLQTGAQYFEEYGFLFGIAYDLIFPIAISMVLYFIFRYGVEKRVRCEIS